MARHLVLPCGAAGAGKTTTAHTLGLDVYDIDDPEWHNDERYFRAALTRLAHTPDAHAVVIRSGATLTARAKAAALIGATETRIIDTDEPTCIERVIARNRPRPPLHVQIAAITSWWSKYGPGLDEKPDLGSPSRSW